MGSFHLFSKSNFKYCLIFFLKAEEVNQFDAAQSVETQDFEPAAEEVNQFDVPDVPAPAVDDFSSINETPTESFDFEGDLSESSLTGQNVETQSGVEAPVVEAPVEEVAAKPPVRSRFGERNVDLPIEVAEDERRYHNDARRFARLLVSEIKLYNEQKVKEGRDTSDLYERLREAIDRSREMYDKRVQPPVAAKFDYFNADSIFSNICSLTRNTFFNSFNVCDGHLPLL